MNTLENDKELDDLLVKHHPKLSDLNVLVRLIDNHVLVKQLFQHATKIFSDVDDALSQYNDPNHILVQFEELSIFAMYDTPPKKIEISGSAYQILRSDFRQKIIVNIIDFDDTNCCKICPLADTTLEKTGGIVTEITIENMMCDNYEVMKEKFDSELLPKIDSSVRNKLFLHQLKQSGIIKYSRANISQSLKIGTIGIFKNHLEPAPIDTPLIEQAQIAQQEEPAKPAKKSPNFLANNQKVVNWISENRPNPNESKLEYHARYTKTQTAISQATLTKIMTALGYTQVKKGKTMCWADFPLNVPQNW